MSFLEDFDRRFSSGIFTAGLTFLFLLLNTPADAFPGQPQPQVIGSPQPIVAVVGADAVLLCRLEPQLNVEDLTVEWTRRDLQTEYVHLYRDGREMLAMKNSLYSGRTVLLKERLKHGDVSLQLTNVTLADQGTYRCFIPKLNSPLKQAVVQLVVERLPQNTPNTQQPARPHEDQETDTEDQETDTEAAPPRRSHLIATVMAVSVISLVLICGACLLIKHRPQGARNNLDGAMVTAA